MGRTNGLPFLRLVPDQFVIDNNLKRIHHHTLTPYTDAEGLRLLQDRWHVNDPKGIYVTAFNECVNVAYAGILTESSASYTHTDNLVCDSADSQVVEASSVNCTLSDSHSSPSIDSPDSDRGGAITTRSEIPITKSQFGSAVRPKRVSFSALASYAPSALGKHQDDVSSRILSTIKDAHSAMHDIELAMLHIERSFKPCNSIDRSIHRHLWGVPDPDPDHTDVDRSIDSLMAVS